MIHLKKLTAVFFVTAAIIMTIANDAHAYLDPGTGSYILQMLAAAIVGALFTIKIFWTRIKSFIKTILGRKSQG